MLFWKKKARAEMVVGALIPPPPKSFRYYRDPGSDNEPAGPGLGIEIIAHSEFQTQTIDTLDAIYNCPTGRQIIDGLVASGKGIKIQKATLGNSCDVGPNGLNSVASELMHSNIGPNSKYALDRIALLTLRRGETKYGWLAAKINATPFYKLKGPPPIVGNNIGVTAADVQGWFEGRATIEVGRTDDQHTHIVNSIILALGPQAQNGIGSDAAIGFNPNPGFVLNTERPAGIGLAHELIHAYWSALGQQEGWTIEHRTTVLFEHKCVGLGHWDHQRAGAAAQICENQIREEWFGNTARLFGAADHVNRGDPGRRNFYSPP